MSRVAFSARRRRRLTPPAVAALRQEQVPRLGLHLGEQGLWRRLWPFMALLLAAGLLSRLAAVLLPDFPGQDFLDGLFRLDSEANLPSLFSTLLMFGAAGALGIIARAKRQVRDPFARVWWALCGLFVYLAVDESAQLHERPAALLGDLLQTGGVLTYVWVVPYGLLCLVVLVSLTRFLGHLPAQTRRGLLVAGTLYVTGAIGFELIEGQLVSLESMAANTPLYILLVVVEEGLEMMGVTLAILTLLGYIRHMLPGLQLTLSLGERLPDSPEPLIVRDVGEVGGRDVRPGEPVNR